MEKALNKAELEEKFLDFFAPAIGGGDDSILKVAAEFSSQYSARQIKALIFLEVMSKGLKESAPYYSELYKIIINRWVEYKRHHGSDQFVMAALQNISLRKFISENSFKVDIKK